MCTRLTLSRLSIAILMLLLAMAQAVTMAGAAPMGRQPMMLQQISVVVDGRLQHYVVAPQMMDGHVMAPMREVFRSLGASIGWEGRAKQVTAIRGQTVVILKVGDREAMVDGRRISLEAAPQLMRGVVFVPLRFVGQALGAAVKWEAGARQVVIASAPATPPAAESPAPEVTPVPPSAPGTPTSSSPEATPQAKAASAMERPMVVETAAEAPATGAEPAAKEQKVSVTLLDYDIRLRPSEVFAGVVKFFVRNLGPSPHALAIDGVKDRTKVLKAGEHTTLKVTFKPGIYTLYCPVDAHRALGMKTRLRVK